MIHIEIQDHIHNQNLSNKSTKNFNSNEKWLKGNKNYNNDNSHLI